MSIFKKISKSRVGINTTAFLLNISIRSLHLTGNWYKKKHKNHLQLERDNKPFIVIFWHSRMIMLPYLKTEGFTMLTSEHKDGQITSRTIKYFGISNVKGSSSKGGAKSILRIRNMIKNNKVSSVGITPDGPRGPAYKLKSGVIFLAMSLKIPIVPVTYSCKKGQFLDSWDCLLMPKLFDKGSIVSGEPIYIDKNEDPEEARQKVEDILTKFTQHVDEKYDKVMPSPSQRHKNKHNKA